MFHPRHLRVIAGAVLPRVDDVRVAKPVPGHAEAALRAKRAEVGGADTARVRAYELNCRTTLSI